MPAVAEKHAPSRSRAARRAPGWRYGPGCWITGSSPPPSRPRCWPFRGKPQHFERYRSGEPLADSRDLLDRAGHCSASTSRCGFCSRTIASSPTVDDPAQPPAPARGP